MQQSQETDEDFSLETNEEDKNYLKFRQSLDSMVDKRAKKYKNYSHPCLRKSNEDLFVRHQIDDTTSDKSADQFTSNQSSNSDRQATKRRTSAENSSTSVYLTPLNTSICSSNRSSIDSSKDRTFEIISSSDTSEKITSNPPTKNSSSSNTLADDRSMEKIKSTKETTKENTREYRVIHRPPLPPSTSKLIYKQMPNIGEFQSNKTSNFNDIIEGILSSNANIREYLRELRKNSELDYLLLSKILEKTLTIKKNVYVQTDEVPKKEYRSVETNTICSKLCQKQTQTRESRILSYKLLETENLFEKLKIQNDFTNSNYEIKRTSDLQSEEVPNGYETTTEYDNRTQFEETKCERNYCSNCHESTRNKTIRIEDKFYGNQDKIHLWNNLLQVDNTSEYSENSNITNQSTKPETTTTSENQSTLSDDEFSVSTRKSKKSFSSVKSTKSFKSTKSNKSIKDELLGERETDLIERYKRIKDFKLRYECEKKEFIELRKQFRELRKDLRKKSKESLKKIEFDEYHQPINAAVTYMNDHYKEKIKEQIKEHNKEQYKEQKKISFDDYESTEKCARYECEEHFDLPVYETSESAFDEVAKDEDENSYLTDSEYSVLDKDEHTNQQVNDEKTKEQVDHSRNFEFIDQERKQVNHQSAVKTESKIFIETTNLRKKEISEISSQTEITKEGLLSRKTQVTNVKKVPVLSTIDSHHLHFNNKTPEPIITSPSTTAATTPSATLQRRSTRKPRSNTVEIHSVTPSTANCSRPASAFDLNLKDDEISPNLINRPPAQLPNQTKGKFFSNSYSEGELNAMKKDKHSIMINEQMNFGISEPFMAYDSEIYNEEETKRPPVYQETPNNKVLKMTFQRKPSFNKRLIENSNLQQIVEWTETNSSTITNEINSEPYKCANGSTKPAKTVSLTTETTLQNNGNERTIETKSKAIRKFDCDKETTNIEMIDGHRGVTRSPSSRNKSPKEEEETSFNPKCDKCNHGQESKASYEKQNKLDAKDSSICVKNVNLDYDYLSTLFNRPSIDYKFTNQFPANSDCSELNTDRTNDKLNRINENLSKLSVDSGHSSSMSSISYQTKAQDKNSDNSTDLSNRNSSTIDGGLDNVDLNEEQRNDLVLSKPNYGSDEFETSLVPTINETLSTVNNLAGNSENNLARNTEIINRIIKTVYPEKKKRMKKKKFVFEQQLNSPSNDQEQNDCKISSLITMEIPCSLRRRCSKCHKNKRQSTSEYYESTSFNPEIEPTLSSLSSTCSSGTDSLVNEEDLNTLTKFQKFRPILINKDDDQTTWEYSLECNCFNGVNASVKTTVTQFHQKNKN